VLINANFIGKSWFMMDMPRDLSVSLVAWNASAASPVALSSFVSSFDGIVIALALLVSFPRNLESTASGRFPRATSSLTIESAHRNPVISASVSLAASAATLAVHIWVAKPRYSDFLHGHKFVQTLVGGQPGIRRRESLHTRAYEQAARLA
jgi:hypothetical protein